jgi:hypothetical protein
MADDNVGFTAQLTIKADKFDVLSFGTSFSRDFDQKGRPSSAVRAGDMSLTIEITDKEGLIDLMVNAQNKPIVLSTSKMAISLVTRKAFNQLVPLISVPIFPSPLKR